eukprot:TRINITY_DN1739_c0_g1_i1.p1 TRINITY_DN1739_c0_g1~~TRINITY_DN1739_c0_g1_i1.p1  ORF type:complete len:366 (-),score=95.57 TRINITY_DN1739_c0_g1_i1:34-1086(-)
MSQNQKPVAVGIMGCGRIAEDMLTALQLTKDIQVVAIASKNLELAQKFATRFGITRAYGNYEQLVADPEVELAYIASTNDKHKDLTLKCLQQKKAVLCEKPFAMNPKEVEEMIQAARDSKLFAMEAMWMNFFPLHKKVRELVHKEKKLGDIVSVRVTHTFNMKSVDDQLTETQKKRIYSAEQGGGSLYDLAVYSLTFFSNIFPNEDPTDINASVQLENGVDLASKAFLTFEKDGRKAVAEFHCSFLESLDNFCEVVGTKGKLKIHDPFHCATDMTLTTFDNNDTQSFNFPLPEIKAKFNFPNSQGLLYEAQEVVHCLREKKTESEWVNLDHSLRISKWIALIRKVVGLDK